ncbi:MAG: tRNA (N6-isopentenyl adenosine(37)-C2)-methylthiotransferase MiaB [Candidatus Omnitrophica bacterium]|nr:tRNA (N6-isopentenyl adenosine(37)-C2)-methylthiotransferase MiaB [Candidatus Omnitrophota bacterium]
MDQHNENNATIAIPDGKPARKLRVLLETYGCQMNEYDSQLVRSILIKDNFEFVDDLKTADVVVLNTCAVRDHAERKIFGRVHQIRHIRGKDNPLIIGILGCMATHLRKALLDDAGLKIDFIAGPDSYKNLKDIIREAQAKGPKSFDVTLSEFETYSDVYPARQKESVNAWVAIMRGCNNFCTFCVVPYTRGRERSRTLDNIMEEVKRLASEGFKQVTLLGQNVNSWHDGPHDFAYLMGQISQIKEIERIRFTSPHPKDFPDSLLDLMAVNPKVCRHIHLPLQAGSDRILEMMNRTYKAQEYLMLIDKIRSKIPHVVLTTDIIVGFPTETDEEFEDTRRIVEKVGFDSAFIFKYSQRQGTIAAKKYKDDVSDADKTKRIVLLNKIQQEITLQKNQAHIGQTHSVLIEPVLEGQGFNKAVGRTDGNKLVYLPLGENKPGDLVRVKITDASPHALKGEYCYSGFPFSRE